MQEEFAKVLLGEAWVNGLSINDAPQIAEAALQRALAARLADPTPTDCICRSLLGTQYSSETPTGDDVATAACPFWEAEHWRIHGNMTVVRVPNQKEGTALYRGLQTYLWRTQRSEQEWWHSEHRTSGATGYEHLERPTWQKFQVVIDLGSAEAGHLDRKLSPYFLKSGLSPTHPAVQVSPAKYYNAGSCSDMSQACCSTVKLHKKHLL